jgi:hypothetical protein
MDNDIKHNIMIKINILDEVENDIWHKLIDHVSMDVIREVDTVLYNDGFDMIQDCYEER